MNVKHLQRVRKTGAVSARRRCERKKRQIGRLQKSTKSSCTMYSAPHTHSLQWFENMFSERLWKWLSVSWKTDYCRKVSVEGFHTGLGIASKVELSRHVRCCHMHSLLYAHVSVCVLPSPVSTWACNVYAGAWRMDMTSQHHSYVVQVFAIRESAKFCHSRN